MMTAQLGLAVPAGGDGDGLRADGFAAGDVVGRIADHEYARGGKITAVKFAGAAKGDGAKVVAEFGVVGKRAEGKEVREIVVAELELGAALEIAREQGLGNARMSVQEFDGFAGAGQHATPPGEERGGERPKIGFEITRESGLAGRKAALRENLTQDPAVGAAGVVDVGERGGDAIFGEQGRFEGVQARAARVSERAIDIPENKSVAHGRSDFWAPGGVGEGKAEAELRADRVGGKLEETGGAAGRHSRKIPLMKLNTWLALAALGVALAAGAGCTSPESRIQRNPEVFARLSPTEQEMIRHGQVGLGFTPEMVKLALGDPDRVLQRTDQSGTSEIWSYVSYEGPDGIILYRGWYHRYYAWGDPLFPYYTSYAGRREREHFRVVFKDGKVISIEHETR